MLVSWCSHFIQWCWGHHRPSCVACFLVPRQTLSSCFRSVGWQWYFQTPFFGSYAQSGSCPLWSEVCFVSATLQETEILALGPRPQWDPGCRLPSVSCFSSISVSGICLLCFSAWLCLFGFLFLYFSLIIFSEEKKKGFFFIECMWVLPACMYVHLVYVVSVEARGGHCSPWNRQLPTVTWVIQTESRSAGPLQPSSSLSLCRRRNG